MKKKFIIILLPVVVIALLFYFFFLNNYLFKLSLPGKILLTKTENYEGISIYYPSKNKVEKFFNGNFYSFVHYNYNENKILTLLQKNSSRYDDSIVEIDAHSKKMTSILNYKDIGYYDNGYFCVFCYDVNYMNKSNNIRFILNDNFTIYNRNTRSMQNIIKVFDYPASLFLDNNRILYNSENSVNLYNMTNKENSKYLDGRNAILSYDNKYIAYYNLKNNLTIRNLSSKEEWDVNLSFNYIQLVFSPDDNYILVSNQFMGLVSNPEYSIYAVDYKTGRKVKLFKGKGPVPGIDWR